LHDAEKSVIIESIGPGDRSLEKSWRIESDGSLSKGTGSESQDTNMIIERLGEFDNTSFRQRVGTFD